MISRLIAVSLTVCYILSTTYSAVIPWNSEENGGDGVTGVAGGSEANEPDILINETNISQETTEPVDPPKYIQNLFLTFTNHSSPLEYNTIRSFENIGQGDCEGDIYTFKFNTSAIMKSELVIKSELRVYLEITSELKGHVDVSLLFMNKTQINTKTLNTSSQWLEFTVSPAIEYWLRNDVNGAQGFKIMVKPNDVAQVCSSTVRLRTDRSDEYLPLLIVYSYETEQSQSSFIQMIEKTMAKETQVSPPYSPNMEGGIRISRSVGQYCQKTTLTLDIDWLNEKIFAPFGRTMLGPPTLNINICGGQCSGLSILSTHSALLSLATKGTPKSMSMTNVCAPLEYQAVQVIMKEGSSTYVIENLESLSVKQCGCITVDRPISCDNR